MKQTLPTTVFLVDDDSAVLRRVTKDSLRETNLGVLTAEDLPTAVKLLEDEEFQIGAVLADLHFRTETHDDEKNLHSGLDFIKYVETVRPDLPIYVLSIDAEDRASRQAAKNMGLSVKAWYDKLSRRNIQFAPWVQIERDLIVEALKAKPDFRDKAAMESGETPSDLITDENVAEKIRNIFNYPRLTYLQYLPEECDYQLTKPIEVHCRPVGDELFRATAVHIPLLVEELGEDPVEALDNLAELLVREKSALDSEDSKHVTGYASFIQQQLDTYLEPLTANKLQ